MKGTEEKEWSNREHQLIVFWLNGSKTWAVLIGLVVDMGIYSEKSTVHAGVLLCLDMFPPYYCCEY